MLRPHLAHPWLPVVVIGAALLAGCQHHVTIDKSTTLATVNGERITERDYRDYIRARELQEPSLPDNPQARRVVLNELINRVLLAQAARKAGLERTAAVHVALKEDRENILARALLKRFLATHRVPMSAIKALYRKNILTTPHEEYEARNILVATRTEALSILQKLHHGVPFSVLARRYSLDGPSADKGGELGWFSAADVLPSFYRALIQLRPGQIAPQPIKTRFGWHIIELQAKRPYTPPSFSAVETRLYRSLEQQSVDNMMAAMRHKADIRYAPTS